MNTTELVEEMAEKFALTKTFSKELITFLTNKITGEVRRGRKVKLTGFGTFYRLTKKARRGYNPKTKEAVQIPSKKVPKFRACRGFRDAVD